MFGGPVFGGERQRVLNAGGVPGEGFEFAALGFVANQHGGAVRSLHAQDSVEVGFVGGEDDIELGGFQAEPDQVARVVVVSQQRQGALAEEVGEPRVVAE